MAVLCDSLINPRLCIDVFMYVFITIIILRV